MLRNEPITDGAGVGALAGGDFFNHLPGAWAKLIRIEHRQSQHRNWPLYPYTGINHLVSPIH